MNGSVMVQLVIIVILTIMNAFFASAEMAIVSINKIKVKSKADKGSKKAILLLKLLEEPSKFLATIQVGITLAGFFSSASAATGLSAKFSVVLESAHIPYPNQISIIVITLILSFVMLVFGELFPKRLALQKTEEIAMFAVKPIYFISLLTAPFVKLLSVSTNLIIKIFGIDDSNLDQKVSEEEIRSLVKVGMEHGVINQTGRKMINNIFEFDDTLAKEVMTTRLDVMMIDIQTPIHNLLEQLQEEKYSRVPVYEGSPDNIVGILLLRTLLFEGNTKGFENLEIKDLITQAYFVSENKAIDKLFVELQKSKKHMALLVDEFGIFTGLVTMEDLIEEIMGDILDEFDHENSMIDQIDINQYKIDGLLSINDFNDYFHMNLVDKNASTISGFMINKLGYIPKENTEEEINLVVGDISLKGLQVEKHIIKEIEVFIKIK